MTYLLAAPRPPLRAYFLRARVRARAGDHEGARRIGRRACGGNRATNVTGPRGLERQGTEPRSALADYEHALEINPRYLTALEDKANVLAEDLRRADLAIAALDQLLGYYPRFVPARAGRGVLHARLGHRAAAHADAREALRTGTTLFNTYQVAGIFALTSRQDPGDRSEAVRLLGSVLSRGFGLDLLETDHDLNAIRDDPEFRQLVAQARARRAGPTRSRQTPKADDRERSPGGKTIGAVTGSG